MNNDPPLRPGMVIAGRYEIVKAIGTGGMGAVFEAKHLLLNQQVAIKCLIPEFAATPEFHARFLREARSAIQIASEHVVRIFDVGLLDTGEPYIVMELLQGIDLHRLLKKGRLPTQDVVTYLVQICDALAEAHALKIIHRDIKPANIFLHESKHGPRIAKLFDFGIAKVTDDDAAALTATGTVVGSSYYMAPEQLRSAKEIDSRTDVYALGVTAFELMTGRRAFEGASVGEICTRVLFGEPLSLDELRPDLPDALRRAIRRAFARNPDERFQTMSDFAAALAPFASSEAISASARLGARASLHSLSDSGSVGPRLDVLKVEPSSGARDAVSAPAVAATPAVSVLTAPPQLSEGNTGTTSSRTLAGAPSARSWLPITIVASVVIGAVYLGFVMGRSSPEEIASATRSASNAGPSPTSQITVMAAAPTTPTVSMAVALSASAPAASASAPPRTTAPRLPAAGSPDIFNDRR